MLTALAVHANNNCREVQPLFAVMQCSLIQVAIVPLQTGCLMMMMGEHIDGL